MRDTLQREINSFSFYKNHLDVILGVFLCKIFRFCEQKIRIEGRSEAQTSASFFEKSFALPFPFLKKGGGKDGR